MANYADGNVVPTRSVAQYLGLEDGPIATLLYAAIESSGQEKFSTLTFFVHRLLGNGNFKIAQMKTDYLVKCDSPSDADKLDGKVKVFKRSIVGFRKLKTVVIPARMSCREDALVLSDARPDQWKCEVEEKYVLTKRKADEQVKKMEQEYEESSSKRNKWYVCCSCKFYLILILFAYHISNLA